MSKHTLLKSDVFSQQILEQARYYKIISGITIAHRFIDAVEQALAFIHQQPLACPIYTASGQHPALQAHLFRAWFVRGFLHKIYFRVVGDKLFIDALYAASMDVPSRMV
jgi:hypothetical protein